MGNGGVYLEDQEDQLSLHHDQEELTYNQVSHQGGPMEKWSFLDSKVWKLFPNLFLREKSESVRNIQPVVVGVSSTNWWITGLVMKETDYLQKEKCPFYLESGAGQYLHFTQLVPLPCPDRSDVLKNISLISL